MQQLLSTPIPSREVWARRLSRLRNDFPGPSPERDSQHFFAAPLGTRVAGAQKSKVVNCESRLQDAELPRMFIFLLRTEDPHQMGLHRICHLLLVPGLRPEQLLPQIAYIVDPGRRLRLFMTPKRDNPVPQRAVAPKQWP